ncbi:MAG: histidinol-phosphatase HisJ family protein [Eubacteriaceae bacterium]|nr:histidinol-phosphatase HisJ family protein [Eubacteriaceae bacterium]
MNADYHIHTDFSDDSECPMEDMVAKAIELGLDEIAFTEHVDYGVKGVDNCDFDRYFNKVEALQKKVRNQITIKTGIEFGVQLATISAFEEAFHLYPFDFVILSNHQIDNQEFWNYEFQKGRTQEEYQHAYYDAIARVIEGYKDYSVLGHLDMIKRYDPAGDYPDENIMGQVDAILKQVIADGKGIEVNTSSFKYGLKDLMPSRAILKRYHELGGEILTIGSDTHETTHLADHFQDVRKILRHIGFKSFCTFDHMQPQYRDL